ncbi:MAG: hypothetical protein O7A03_08540, partial [Alphaproteobacteria bacterium]|nr:hypothetical protein [Alphaproteobacteria bacterium]
MSEPKPVVTNPQVPRRYRPQWGRWAIYAGVVLLASVVGAGLGAWGIASLSVPDYDGEATLAGLAAPVTVTRDAHAVPR